VESVKGQDAINKALGAAQSAKIRYNAERISRTELARAYNEGVNARFDDDDSVTGYKWSLSSRHVFTDECTLFAELDNGAGPGVYRKDDFPTLPAHPNCMCIKDPHYGEMPKKVEFRRVKDYLKEQPDKRRAAMIGKAEAVNETLYRRGLEKRNIHFGEDSRRVPEELIEAVTEESSGEDLNLGGESAIFNTRPEFSGVVEGKSIVGEYRGNSGEFKHTIKDVVHKQGFDGLPRVVSKEEFDELVKDDHFVAQRTVYADSQELLDQYKEQLRSGDWYISCDVGGAQHGQGMYCAADYSKGGNWGGISAEMDTYAAIGVDKGKPFNYQDTLTIDRSAKILTVPKDREAAEYIKEQHRLAYFNRFATDEQKLAVNEFSRLTAEIDRTKDLDRVDLLRNERHALLDVPLKDLQKRSSAASKDWVEGVEFPKAKDPGVLAVEMGYDAINAVGHGASGSYTIVLNRTKLIIRGGQ